MPALDNYTREIIKKRDGLRSTYKALEADLSPELMLRVRAVARMAFDLGRAYQQHEHRLFMEEDEDEKQDYGSE